jgi:hypothetical protein
VSKIAGLNNRSPSIRLALVFLNIVIKSHGCVGCGALPTHPSESTSSFSIRVGAYRIGTLADQISSRERKRRISAERFGSASNFSRYTRRQAQANEQKITDTQITNEQNCRRAHSRHCQNHEFTSTGQYRTMNSCRSSERPTLNRWNPK